MSDIQKYYDEIKKAILQSMHDDWDVAIGNIEVAVKGCNTRMFYEKNGVRLPALGQANFETAINCMRAARSIRDKIFLDTSRRIWGINLNVDRNNKLDVELVYEKPKSYDYDDTEEWTIYLMELQGNSENRLL